MLMAVIFLLIKRLIYNGESVWMNLSDVYMAEKMHVYGQICPVHKS